jgi:hypothetical protein
MGMAFTAANTAFSSHLKKVQRETRPIIFVDESGISEGPTRTGTPVLQGQTPLIELHLNWTHIPVIAGLIQGNCLSTLALGQHREARSRIRSKQLRIIAACCAQVDNVVTS